MAKETLDTTPGRAALMRRVRQKNTEPEVVVRSLLRDIGAHYRTNVKGLPGRPDIAHKGRKKALFVNGCYWHFHDVCEHGAVPRSNDAFWSEKFEGNRQRDQRKITALEELGFDVSVVWECELAEPEILLHRLERFWFGSAVNGKASRSTPVSDGVESYSIDVDSNELVRAVRRRDGSSAESRLPLLLPVLGGDAASSYDQTWLRMNQPPPIRSDARAVRIVDLFSGCGGMTLGAVEACRALDLWPVPVLAWDLDRRALAAYHRNFAELGCDRIDDNPIETVLNGALGEEPTDAEIQLRDELGRVDLVLGGPPCQGHSNLNNHTRREDPKNALFARMARFAEIVRPSHLVVENVLGVLHDRDGVFDLTRRHLQELGYKVAHAVLQSERLGVPQQRHRVFLVASTVVAPDLEVLMDEYEVAERSFEWGCHDLLFAPVTNSRHLTAQPTSVTRERIDYLFEHGLYELPDEERPPCHRGGNHAYPSVYGRIHPERPTQTITTGFMTMGQGRFVHPYQRRTLTPHEAARLQFIPDWFDFGSLNRSEFTRLIGNAVPPKMVYTIVSHLLR